MVLVLEIDLKYWNSNVVQEELISFCTPCFLLCCVVSRIIHYHNFSELNKLTFPIGTEETILTDKKMNFSNTTLAGITPYILMLKLDIDKSRWVLWLVLGLLTIFRPAKFDAFYKKLAVTHYIKLFRNWLLDLKTLLGIDYGYNCANLE